MKERNMDLRKDDHKHHHMYFDFVYVECSNICTWVDYGTTKSWIMFMQTGTRV